MSLGGTAPGHVLDSAVIERTLATKVSHPGQILPLNALFSFDTRRATDTSGFRLCSSVQSFAWLRSM